MANDSLEQMYRAHHSERRGEDFALLGNERGAFLASCIGTGKTVLDIGCRDGALTKSYANGNKVLGIDIDSVALERAKERLGIDIRQIDLNGSWDLEDRSYDIVVACEIIEHLYYPADVLSKISAVLKPGGLLLGSVPNAFSFAHRSRYLRGTKKGTPLSDPTHINHFTVRELESLLSEQFASSEIVGMGRLGPLARRFPQAFAFDLCFEAKKSI